MERVIKIRNLKKIDDTSVQVLRTISLKLGDKHEGYVDYKIIAMSLGLDEKQGRKIVASSVNRMVASGILKKQNGKLSIPIADIVNL